MHRKKIYVSERGDGLIILTVGQPHTVHPDICLSQVIQCHDSKRTKFILCIGVIRLMLLFFLFCFDFDQCHVTAIQHDSCS